MSDLFYILKCACCGRADRGDELTKTASEDITWATSIGAQVNLTLLLRKMYARGYERGYDDRAG